jgi:alpha-L-rhamnosidase
MSRWLKFLQQKNLQADFTISTGFYGDWVDAASMDEGTTDSGGTSRPLMYSAYFFHNCRILARVAERLGHGGDAAEFSALAEKVRAGFLARFYDPLKKKFESETQCSYILPLAFGLVPPDDHAAVVANLVEDIMVKHRGHLSVGLIGMQWFMQVLTDAGHPEVAYHVATRDTRPSWGYMIRQGGTSIWERWDQDTRDPGMNGESQLILAGNLGAWFYQTLGGINADPEQPAFKHIILRPRPVGDLQWVKCSFKSQHGTIRSDWNIEGETFHWRIAVPPNTTATFHIPTRDADSVREGDLPAGSASGVKFLRMAGGEAVFEVRSGHYDFSSRISPTKSPS